MPKYGRKPTLIQWQTSEPVSQTLLDQIGSKCLADKGNPPRFECQGLFIKTFRLSPVERLKALFKPTKAKREWNALLMLHKRGINVPRPVAYGKHNRTEIIVLELINGKSLSLVNPEQLRSLIPKIAHNIKLLHEAGFFHKDLHLGNILVSNDEVILIDFHRNRFYPQGLPTKKRIWDIACLLYDIKDEELRKLFLQNYGISHLEDAVCKAIEKVELRQIRHIRESCFKNSSDFRKINLKKLKGWCRKEIEIDTLESIIEKHKRVLSEGNDEVKKATRRTAVTLIHIHGKRYCVKEYRFPSAYLRLKELFRLPKPRRAWLNGNILYSKGMGMKPLALLEWRDFLILREAYLVFESPPQFTELPAAFRETQEKGGLLKAVVKFLNKLGKMKVFHKDLKAHHILVAKGPEGWSCVLIEPEDVTFGRKIKFKTHLRYLKQLHSTCPSWIPYLTRLRFLSLYLKENELQKGKVLSLVP